MTNTNTFGHCRGHSQIWCSRWEYSHPTDNHQAWGPSQLPFPSRRSWMCSCSLTPSYCHNSEVKSSRSATIPHGGLQPSLQPPLSPCSATSIPVRSQNTPSSSFSWDLVSFSSFQSHEDSLKTSSISLVSQHSSLEYFSSWDGTFWCTYLLPPRHPQGAQLSPFTPPQLRPSWHTQEPICLRNVCRKVLKPGKYGGSQPPWQSVTTSLATELWGVCWPENRLREGNCFFEISTSSTALKRNN